MVDINVDVMLAQKKGAMEVARRSARPIAEAVDDRGKVSLWLIAQKKWVRFWPVDAVDILKSGTANLDGPEPEPDPEPEEAKKNTSPETGKLEEGTIEDLRKLAKERKIDLGKLTKKKDIIAKIRAESETPPEVQGDSQE